MGIEQLSNKQLISLQDSTARINLFEGPVRAGKSFIALLRWIEFCRSGPKGPLIICGKTDKTIKRNIINPLQELVGNAVRYSSGKGEVTMYDRTMVVCGANDDRAEAKIRGNEYAGGLIDEVSLMPENFFKMLLSRLSIDGAQLFCSTNPDSPYHWFKRDFMDRRNEIDMKVFSYNIRDNPSLSEKYIENLSKEYQGLWYKRYIEGKWVLADGAVYDFFDNDIHVIPMARSEATFYLCGIDYGTTNPCVFVLIGYNSGSYPNMWLEKEYYYDSKKELKQKSDYEYAKDFIDFASGYNIKHIYIDPSALSLKMELRRNGIGSIVDAKNDVIPGIRFQALLLTNGTYKVCSSCTESIKEYSNYLWDSKASEKGEDKPVKKNDHCFAKGTLVTTYFGQRPIERVMLGDKVLTPIGYKYVKEIFIHEDEVYEYDIFGKKIRCTKNHRFYTVNRGWIEVKDMLLSDIILIHTENGEWKGKPPFLTESNIQGTYAPKMKILENIIEHLSKTNLRDATLSIGMSGDFTMEKSHQECIYITSTSIPSTMTLTTSSYFLPWSIQENIRKCLQVNKKKLEKNTATKYDYLQKNGIEVKKEGDGTVSMQVVQSKKRLKEVSNVSGVQQSILPPIDQPQNFVVINVKANGEEIITLTMSSEYANCVLNDSQQTNTKKPNIAQSLAEAKPTGMQKVYNLHVEDYHGFYAENMLALNCCDAQRYALYSYFFKKDLKEDFTEDDARRMEAAYAWRY